MSEDRPKQCMYCSQWIKGDLWMTVHEEMAHSDLRPLFSGTDTKDRITRGTREH